MKKLLTALALSFAFVASAPEAQAQQKPKAAQGAKKGGKAKAPAGDQVKVQVMVVHATDGKDYVDPKLAKLERHLEFLKYSSYEVLKTESDSLRQDKSTSFSIEGGRKVTVTLLGKDDSKARLRVQMYKADKKLVDTTVSVKRGATFVVAGPKYQGGMLLLPITAKY